MGLYNSSPGTIVDIIYHQDSDPSKDLPKYVLVELDNYKGELIRGRKIFPIRYVKKNTILFILFEFL